MNYIRAHCIKDKNKSLFGIQTANITSIGVTHKITLMLEYESSLHSSVQLLQFGAQLGQLKAESQLMAVMKLGNF